MTSEPPRPITQITYSDSRRFITMNSPSILNADLPRSAADLNAALHHSAADGDAPEVRRLLGAGASVHAVDKYNDTALQIAARNGCLSVVQCLLEAGADVDARSWRRTALLVAARYGHLAVVRCLLEAGAAVNNYNSKALHLAAERGYLDVVRLLCEWGADPTIKDMQGCTAVDRARYAGRTVCASWLLGPEESPDEDI